jgi:organic radical activating enzyme
MELEEHQIISRLDTYADITVITGGEPMAQDITGLILLLQDAGYKVHIETNGTFGTHDEANWVTVSPKRGTQIPHKLNMFHEAKWLVPEWPLSEINFELAYENYVQPLDDENLNKNTLMCLEYIKEDPSLRLSVQLHKLLGLK